MLVGAHGLLCHREARRAVAISRTSRRCQDFESEEILQQTPRRLRHPSRGRVLTHSRWMWVALKPVAYFSTNPRNRLTTMCAVGIKPREVINMLPAKRPIRRALP